MTNIRIYPDQKKHEISPLLYGAFFEDINYGGDGGLYAELIANRSFSYYDRNQQVDKHKMCWEALPDTEFVIRTENPLNTVHTHYAAISGGAGCGICNRGFCGEGFATDRDGAFLFSCYVRTDTDTEIAAVISDTEDGILGTAGSLCTAAGERNEYEPELNSGFSDAKGGILGTAGFLCTAAGDWRKYELEITANAKCRNAYLSVILPRGGSAELAFVSLFPRDTFRGRENGMRKDIAEVIADLKPAFLRFPGGCIVEGRSFDNMYCWKDTIGPVEERRTNWNRWQMEEYRNLGYDASDYFQSYGIGFYEYFQFCEDIGAKPVPVVNCGMTCQWHEALLVELEHLYPYIQDVLDLIEFANGSPDSEWGRKRAMMGHEAPFHLKYIGIGNEQWGREYFERYEIFQQKISERYPDIKLITCAGWKDHGWEFDLAYDWMKENKEKAYAVDEHFYKEPEWFLNNIGRYDSYDRTLPKVFIGEYAAHTSGTVRERHNNWYSALAEAAFLTGVENNADHVVMTCYAPLLAKLQHQQWQPDLIWFDNEGVYATPNYYIQKLFSQHLGEYTVEWECEDPDLKISVAMGDNRLIIKLVNVSGEDKQIHLDVGQNYGIKERLVLHADLSAENTLEKPWNVYPVHVEDGDLLKGYSVMVLELSLLTHTH